MLLKLVYSITGIIPSLEDIIGTTYADDPIGFIIGCMFVMWFMYQVFMFLHYLVGNRK